MVILVLLIILIVFLPTIVFLALFIVERGKNKRHRLMIDDLQRQLREMQGHGDVTPLAQPVQSTQVAHPIGVEPIQAQPELQAQPGQQVQTVQTVQPVQPIQQAQQVQTVQPVQQVRPTFVQKQHSPEQSKRNARNILLWLGVVFITIAGCVFATTQWQVMSDVAKVVIIMGTVALFFGLSAVSTKVLKIEQTGKAFYTLGCIFLPISLIASAYFHLFGSWFTYAGNGYWLFWATCSILLGVSLGVGVYIYHKQWIFVLTMICVTIAVSCVIGGNVYTNDKIQLCYSIYLLFLTLANIFVKIPKKYKRSTNIFTKCHFYILGIPFLLMSGEATFLNLLAILIALASLLFSYAKTNENGYRNCFLCYYLCLFVIARRIPANNISNLIMVIYVVISFLAFHIITEKKLVTLRTGLADGLLIGAGVFNIIDNYSQREYMFGSGFKTNTILCVLFVIFMVLWVVLEKNRKNYAKGVAFLAPILVILLMENLFNGIFEVHTIVWLIGLSIVGLAIVIKLLKNILPQLQILDLPFFIASIIAMIVCFVPPLGNFEGIFTWTNSVIGYALSAVYFGIRGAIAHKEPKKPLAMVMTIAMLCMATISAFGILSAIDEWTYTPWAYEMKYHPLAVSIFLVIVFFIGVIIKGKCERNSRVWTWFASITMIISTSGMVLFATQSYVTDVIYLWVTLIYLGIAIWMTFYMHITLLAIPTVLMFIYTLNYQLGMNIEVGVVILSVEAITTMLLSRTLFPNLFLASEKGKRFYSFDILVVATLFLIGWMMLLGTRADITIALVILAVFFLNFYRRDIGDTGQRVMFTLAGASLLLAWWVQPWLDIPEFIKMELMVMPVIAIALILQLFIWKGHRAVMENITFGCAILGVIILIDDALDNQQLFDVMFLGIVALAVLLYSFYFKRKKWFYYSVVVLLVLAIYLTRQFWLSIAWWAYLLIVGVLLIVIAAWNERLKQKGTSIKKKTKRLWEDWTW